MSSTHIQASKSLIRRASETDARLRDAQHVPRCNVNFDFRLDTDTLARTIYAMNFYQMKGWRINHLFNIFTQCILIVDIPQCIYYSYSFILIHRI